ncbi:MAG: GDSL family lipase [Clostridia bacterium]|nr:GDSL family lipase [Clostridia bacterium]
MADFILARLAKGNSKTYEEHGPINVVICGDSVSHGAVNGFFDYHTLYHNRLRLMIQQKYHLLPVNMINTAFSGMRAKYGDDHFDRDVAPHNPDLVIVCFGLNDINVSLEDYLTPLCSIFDKCLAHSFDCIFMTPNMLNTYVADETAEGLRGYAKTTAGYQNSGRMDTYISAAIEAAKERGIPVCDCYGKWKAMAAEGVDTTALLANHINHPTQEMHKLFADSLYELIFGEPYDGKPLDSHFNTMYQGK